MPLKKSPGGSIFPYPYKGGELFGLHLGSFGTNEVALIDRMKAEAVFFAGQNRSLGIWIDFYQTKLTIHVIDGFIEYLRQAGDRILKLGLVGCSSADQRRINRRMQAADYFPTYPVKYFRDPEVAKTWLVSEG